MGSSALLSINTLAKLITITMTTQPIISSPIIPEAEGPIHDERSRILGATDAARFLGLSRTQVWRLAATGEIPSICLGTARRPRYHFRIADLEQVKKAREAAHVEASLLKGSSRGQRQQRRFRKVRALVLSGKLDLRDFPSFPPIRWAGSSR